MATVEIWPIYDELEELEQCHDAITELLEPDAQPNRDRLALLLRRLQKQKANVMKQLHDALMEPV